MDRVRRMLGCDSPEALPYTGKNVYVAVLDSGIALHPDFMGRIVAFRDFTGTKGSWGSYSCYDDNGHGTHVCGILAGSGAASKGKYKGVAPECLLICGKVLDKKGSGSLKGLLRGIEWIMETRKRYPIRVVNISIEMDDEEKLNQEELELLREYFEELWRQEIIIVAAAGNKGPNPMTLSPIGESGSCICVGCNDGDYKGADGRACSDYSGRGPGKRIDRRTHANPLKKPDIVAPGTDIVSCNYRFRQRPYIAKSGTSMSAPIVSGACALCLHKYPWLSNSELRRILLGTAKDMGQGWSVQGAGLLQIDRLLTEGPVLKN